MHFHPLKWIPVTWCSKHVQKGRKYGAVDQRHAEVHGWGASFCAGCGGCVPRLETGVVPSGIHASMKLICESRSIFPPCCTPSRPPWLKTLLGCVVFAIMAVRWWTLIALQLKLRRPRSSKNHELFRQATEFLAKHLRWIPTTCWASAKVQAPVRSDSFLLTILQGFHRFFWGEDSEDGEEAKKPTERRLISGSRGL